MALILVVDDFRHSPLARARMLHSRAMVRCWPSTGGRDLYWRKHGADLVMLDIHMPDTDGIEVLVQLRGLAPGLPVIVMSGGDQTSRLDLLADAKLLGAWAVLRKPYTLDRSARACDPGGRHAGWAPRRWQGRDRIGSGQSISQARGHPVRVAFRL